MPALHPHPVAADSLSGRGGDPLDGIRPEAAGEDRTLASVCDTDSVRTALKGVHPDVSGLGWREAVTWLKEGLVVKLDCATASAVVTRSSPTNTHYLFFGPDGTVVMLNHPREGHPALLDEVQAAHTAAAKAEAVPRRVPENPPEEHTHEAETLDETKARREREQAVAKVRRAAEFAAALEAAKDTARTSTDLDLDPLLALHALGAPLSGCVKVALWLTHSQRDPAGLGGRLDEVFDLTTTWHQRFRHRHIPPAYAMVAWAQRPLWPKGAGQRFLDHGVTPHLLRTWIDLGWTVHTAELFLRCGARLDVADLWRLAGDVSPRAARLAGLGERPDVTEQPWLDAGFAPGESDQWRARKEFGQIPRLAPEEAYEWHRHGVRPNSVRDFKALATTVEGAAEQTRKRLGQRSACRSDGTRHYMAVPTLQRAKEWAAAGVPSEMVLAWCGEIGDDDEALAIAVDWARVIPARQFQTISDWNHTHHEAPLRPEDVDRLRRIGMTTDGENMGRLIASGLSNNDILRPVQMLVTGKRWHGRALRAHLAAVASAHQASGAAGAWAKNSRLPEQILDDKWTGVVGTLKGIWMPENVATWRVVTDWLETDPTPPPPYAYRRNRYDHAATGTTR